MILPSPNIDWLFGVLYYMQLFVYTVIVLLLCLFVSVLFILLRFMYFSLCAFVYLLQLKYLVTIQMFMFFRMAQPLLLFLSGCALFFFRNYFLCIKITIKTVVVVVVVLNRRRLNWMVTSPGSHHRI